MQELKLTSVDGFAARLCLLIDQRLGGTQAELARRAKITTAAIANYASKEKGRIPKSEELYRIAKALGVSMEFLLTGNPSAETTSSVVSRSTLVDKREIQAALAQAKEAIALAERALKKI